MLCTRCESTLNMLAIDCQTRWIEIKRWVIISQKKTHQNFMWFGNHAYMKERNSNSLHFFFHLFEFATINYISIYNTHVSLSPKNKLIDIIIKIPITQERAIIWLNQNARYKPNSIKVSLRLFNWILRKSNYFFVPVQACISIVQFKK